MAAGAGAEGDDSENGFFSLCCHSAAESSASDGLPTHQPSVAGPCLSAINFGHTEGFWFGVFLLVLKQIWLYCCGIAHC